MLLLVGLLLAARGPASGSDEANFVNLDISPLQVHPLTAVISNLSSPGLTDRRLDQLHKSCEAHVARWCNKENDNRAHRERVPVGNCPIDITPEHLDTELARLQGLAASLCPPPHGLGFGVTCRPIQERSKGEPFYHDSWCLALHVIGVFPAAAATGSKLPVRTIEGRLNLGAGDSSMPAGLGFDRGRFYQSLRAGRGGDISQAFLTNVNFCDGEVIQLYASCTRNTIHQVPASYPTFPQWMREVRAEAEIKRGATPGPGQGDGGGPPSGNSNAAGTDGRLYQKVGAEHAAMKPPNLNLNPNGFHAWYVACLKAAPPPPPHPPVPPPRYLLACVDRPCSSATGYGERLRHQGRARRALPAPRRQGPQANHQLPPCAAAGNSDRFGVRDHLHGEDYQ